MFCDSWSSYRTHINISNRIVISQLSALIVYVFRWQLSASFYFDFSQRTLFFVQSLNSIAWCQTKRCSQQILRLELDFFKQKHCAILVISMKGKIAIFHGFLNQISNQINVKSKINCGIWLFSQHFIHLSDKIVRSKFIKWILRRFHQPT